MQYTYFKMHCCTTSQRVKQKITYSSKHFYTYSTTILAYHFNLTVPTCTQVRAISTCSSPQTCRLQYICPSSEWRDVTSHVGDIQNDYDEQLVAWSPRESHARYVYRPTYTLSVLMRMWQSRTILNLGCS